MLFFDEDTQKSTDTLSLQQALIEALTKAEHRISPKWLYDQRGSELFEEITKLSSYYPTRTELSILEDNRDDIASVIGQDRLIVELGSGSSRKTLGLLKSLKHPAGYIPVDISSEYLHQATANLTNQLPDLSIMALVADFTTTVSIRFQ